MRGVRIDTFFVVTGGQGVNFLQQVMDGFVLPEHIIRFFFPSFFLLLSFTI